MDSISDDVLTEIFLRVQDPRTIANCALVCRRWAAILATSSPFWVTKCKFDGRLLPVSLLAEANARGNRLDMRIIWRKNPYDRNLIKNDSGQERFKHWTIDPQGWTQSQRYAGPNAGLMHPIEKPPSGAHGEGIESCFVTSYSHCQKEQLVDLRSEGVEYWILDELKPSIIVSEWHGSRRDSGARYGMEIALLGENSEPLENGTFEFQRVMKCSDGGSFMEVSHRFLNYPRGLRYIRFRSYGRDTSSWSGFFGAKMAKASVRIEFQQS